MLGVSVNPALPQDFCNTTAGKAEAHRTLRNFVEVLNAVAGFGCWEAKYIDNPVLKLTNLEPVVDGPLGTGYLDFPHEVATSVHYWNGKRNFETIKGDGSSKPLFVVAFSWEILVTKELGVTAARFRKGALP